MTDFNASASHISMMHRPFGPRVLMDENAAGGAPAGGGGGSDAGSAGASASMPESFSDVGAAYRHLTSQREKREPAADAGADPDPSATAAARAPADPELSDEGNAGAETPPSETNATDQEANLPPIEAPRSWSKEDKELFNGLPRETQERIAERERSRESDFLRRQNDAANQLKGLSAKEQAAEQARQNYENQARQAMNILLREQQRDFPDIKSMDDVRNLSVSDPLRYLQWQAHQQELQMQAAAVKDADDRAAAQKSTEWTSFRSEQDKLAMEHIPDLGNAERAPALMKKAVDYLQELKFTPEELGAYDKGEKLSLFDHRVQRLIFDAVRYQDAQKAAAKAVTKPVPPVQRPGTKPAGNGNTDRLQSLNAKLTNSGSLKDAAALLAARRHATR